MTRNHGLWYPGDVMDQRYSVRDIARGTGISASHVSRILNGLRDPTASTLNRVAGYMGKSLGELQAEIQSKKQRRRATPKLATAPLSGAPNPRPAS